VCLLSRVQSVLLVARRGSTRRATTPIISHQHCGANLSRDMASELSCAEHPEASGCVRFLSAAPKKAGAEVVVADIDKEKVEGTYRTWSMR
jgi:hypothetical protein